MNGHFDDKPTMIKKISDAIGLEALRNELAIFLTHNYSNQEIENGNERVSIDFISNLCYVILNRPITNSRSHNSEKPKKGELLIFDETGKTVIVSKVKVVPMNGDKAYIEIYLDPPPPRQDPALPFIICSINELADKSN